jgi:hypothetical protein
MDKGYKVSILRGKHHFLQMKVAMEDGIAQLCMVKWKHAKMQFVWRAVVSVPK